MPRPDQIDYALFDFDGVIADTEPLFLELDRQALVQLGYTPTDDELHSFIGHPSEIMVPALLERHGIHKTSEDYLALRDVSKGIYGNPALEPMAGIAELWRRLRDRDVRVAVVSSSRAADLVGALGRWGLLSCIDALVAREHVSRTKPDPEPYLKALAVLSPNGNEPQLRGIAFEDSPTGIAAAKAAGLYTVGFAGGSVVQDVSGADEVCASFSAFAASL